MWEEGQRILEEASALLGEDASAEAILALAIEFLNKEPLEEDREMFETSVADPWLFDVEASAPASLSGQTDWSATGDAPRVGGVATLLSALAQASGRPVLEAFGLEDEAPHEASAIEEPSRSGSPSLAEIWKSRLSAPPTSAFISFDVGQETSSFALSLQPSRSKQTQVGVEYEIQTHERTSFCVDMAEDAYLFVFQEKLTPHPTSAELVYPFPSDIPEEGWTSENLPRWPAFQGELFDFSFDLPQTVRWYAFFASRSPWEIEPSLPPSLSSDDLLNFFTSPHPQIVGFSFLLLIEA